MLNRFALLMLCACTALLAGCAGQIQQEESLVAEQAYAPKSTHQMSSSKVKPQNLAVEQVEDEEEAAYEEADEGLTAGLMRHAKSMVLNLSQVPAAAGNLLGRGFELLGTPYRYGGTTLSGFDCSGFVSYLFREEVGIDLPRSTREMIQMDAPKVARHKLQPGDILFFNNRGRGQVSHTGIYIGEDRFIHSASRKGGGVRVDSLEDRYWDSSYMQAKRVLGTQPDA